MKTKLRFMALVLLGMMLSVNYVWGANSGLTAVPGSFILDFYDSSKLSSTSGTGLSLQNCSTMVTLPAGISYSDVITAINNTGTAQYGKNGGLTWGTNTAAYTYTTFTIGTNFPIRKVTIVGALYDSNVPLYVNTTNASDGLNAKGTTYANCANNKEVSLDYVNSLLIGQNDGSKSGSKYKRVTLYTAVCEYGYRVHVVQGATGTISATPSTENENGAGWNSSLSSVVGLKTSQQVSLSGLPSGYAWKATKTIGGDDVTESIISGNVLTMPNPAYDVEITIVAAASTKTAVTLEPTSASRTVTVDEMIENISSWYTVDPNTYDGTIEYASSDEDVFTVEEGVGYALKAGSCSLYVSAPETEKYKAANCTIPVTVNQKACTKSITITKGTPSNGTFDLSQTGSVCVDDAKASVNVTNISPNEHYHFTQITATNGTVDNTNKQVTNISENTTINVEFAEDAKYTVEWYVAGVKLTEGSQSTSVYENEKVTTIPTAPADGAAGTCATKFMGWSVTPIVSTPQKTAPTDLFTTQEGSPEVTSSMVKDNKIKFYAVFASEAE